MANPALLQQFNQFSGERKTLIRKALDTSVGAGTTPITPLISQKLEKIITNTMVRLSPELAVIEQEYDAQKFHEFNRLTALPEADGFMGESATTPTYNAQYVRDNVELKILRRKGAVTNFLQDASKNYIDAAAAEMENHLQAHAYDMIAALEYGNKSANKYAFDGLDTLIKTNRWNNAVGGVVPTDLSFLDEMIDCNMEKQGGAHKKAFIMSPQMQSVVSRLLTNVRLMQGSGGLAKVEIEGGWRLEAYRGIPILPVSSMNSKKKKMGAITVASGTTNYFRVSAVTYDGESEASDEVQGGTVGAVNLAWTPIPGAFYYKIYAGTAAGGEKLVLVIPARTFDAVGTPSAQVTGVDITTTPTAVNPTCTLIAPTGVLTGPTTSVVADGNGKDVPLVSTGGVVPENIVLWDLDKYQGLGKVPYTNSGGDRFQGLVTMVPLAVTDDNLPFLIRSYMALCPSFEETSIISRSWRVK